MVRRTLVVVAAVSVVAGFGATVGFAQNTADVAALQQADAKAQAEQAAREEIARDRTGVVASLVERWRDRLSDGGEELAAFLRQAPIERIWEASQARDFNAFQSALAGRKAISNVFGQTDGDLVFTPVAPCRLFDTRSAAAGILSAGVVRNFLVNGNMTTQGGDAGGCGIPVDPLAVVVNLAAVTPTGAGNIRAWRYLDPVPAAAAMNYNPTNTSPALSNMIVIPTCFICGLDISLRSDVSNVHAVGDVVGYFLNPASLPTTRITTFSGVAIASTDTTLTTLTFTPARTGTVLAEGSAWCNIAVANDNVIIGFGETSSPFTDNAVLKNNGTGNAQGTMAVQQRFTTTAGTPLTITLTGRREVGTGTPNCTGQLTAIELF
jgi:hypothetical protein